MFAFFGKWRLGRELGKYLEPSSRKDALVVLLLAESIESEVAQYASIRRKALAEVESVILAMLMYWQGNEGTSPSLLQIQNALQDFARNETAREFSRLADALLSSYVGKVWAARDASPSSTIAYTFLARHTEARDPLRWIPCHIFLVNMAMGVKEKWGDATGQ